MDTTSNTANNSTKQQQIRKTNQNIQVYVRVRPLNSRERGIRSNEVVEVPTPREIVARHSVDSKLTKKFTFDRSFGPDSRQVDVYTTVVAPLIEEVLGGYNCTVFAYGQTGTGKTHTMVGNECAELKSSWEDGSEVGIIPRALSHLFDELRLMELEYTMRISYLELYNEELCDLLSTDDSTKIRIFDDSTKKGSVIIQGLEEIPVHSKNDVYKLLEKGKERRKTATTLMNAQSSRSHTVFSIVVHIRENGIDGEDMLKIGKLNLVDLAGSENVSKAGNEKGIRVRETVNINQSLLTLGRVITALVERAPHIPYRESKLTRLLQESLGGRTKTSIIATISPGHKDIEETLSTLEYAHRAKHIQNKPEVNQKLTKKTVLKEYTEEIDKLKRDLMAARDRNGIYLAEESYNEMTLKMDHQNRELNEKVLLIKALKDELFNKEKIFNEVSLNLVEKTAELKKTEENLYNTKNTLLFTKKVLNTTKRRYKEKKVLLEAHVKTEEILTNQAAQIMEVADIATDDTHQLHNAIERRKDVDKKIRTACQIFTEHMEENFDMVDENLQFYQEKQQNHTKVLMDKFAQSNVVHDSLLTNSDKNIEQLKQLCDDAQSSSNKLQEEYFRIIGDLSEKHRSELTSLFKKMKARELVKVSEVQQNLADLGNNNDQLRNTIDTLREIVTDILEKNTQDVNAHAQQLRSQIENISKLVTAKTKEISMLHSDLQAKTALEEREEALIGEIEARLKEVGELKQQRLTKSANMHKVLKRLEEQDNTIETELQQNMQLNSSYANQQQHTNVNSLANLDVPLKAGMLSVDQCFAKCSTIKVQLENQCQERTNEIENFVQAEDTHCSQIKLTTDDSLGQVKRMRFEQSAQINAACQTAQNAVVEDLQRLRGHVAVAVEYTEQMQQQLQDFNATHKAQLNTCRNDLRKFEKSELKSYSSTGATPSKRDFVYPRILTATSPHQAIVRHVREENDWSDADTTVATINEDSEDDDEPQSVQEFNVTETIMNSTPVNRPTILINSNSTNGSSANMLKPQQQQQQHLSRSNSLKRNQLTPRKTTPRKSPMLTIDNKENVA